MRRLGPILSFSTENYWACEQSISFLGSKDTSNPLFYVWLCSLILGTFYTLTWDLKMDWGLFSKDAGENRFLREQIVYDYKVLNTHLCTYARGTESVTLGYLENSSKLLGTESLYLKLPTLQKLCYTRFFSEAATGGVL